MKFAYGSSVLLSGQNVTEALMDTSLDTKMGFRRWRMAVNGSKTGILHLPNSHEEFTQIKINRAKFKMSETTKSLVLNVVSEVNYKQHTELSVAKNYAKLAYSPKTLQHQVVHYPTTLVYLYRPDIQPQNPYRVPIWAQKITLQQIFQNNSLRAIFKNRLSPHISTAEVLTGIPPTELFCQSLAVLYHSD